MKIMQNRSILSCIALAGGLVYLAGLGLSCRTEAPERVDSDEKVAAQYVSEADPLYNLRSDLSKVRMGVALLRQARIADYGSYEAAWKLSRSDYYLGAHTNDERERDEAFREGIEAGKAAMQLEGGKPEGHFWLGANYGGSAEHSTLAGLSSIEEIRNEMEAVLRIDEAYQGGSAYLGLGQLYLQAPRILGGDVQKAIEYLEKGLRFGNNSALLRLRLAEAYHAANRNAEARKHINYVLKMKPDPDYRPEYEQAVDKAKKLLEKIDGK